LIEHLAAHPPRLSDGISLTSRALAAGHAIQVEDTMNDPGFARKDVQQVGGFRTLLAVPVLREGTPLGVLTLGRVDVRAFTEKEIELVTSFADQAAIAMENVRLFNETQRLLAETKRRNAELAVINSIQQGMSRSLDFQGIVDVVGDTLREVLHSQDIGIRWIDPSSNRVLPLYVFEHGERKTLPPRPMRTHGPGSTVTATRQPLVFNSAAELVAAGFPGLPGPDPARSTAFVPVLGNDRVSAIITIEDFERDDAYGEAEVRLLQTVAGPRWPRCAPRST
jgi:GAF domain-containing protein